MAGWRKRLGLLAALGALYFFLSFPFHRLVFLGGHIEMRFSGFVPMVAGLVLGWPGAAMCAVLNFAADSLDGILVTDVLGSIGVFLMGWLPYRMWATLFFGKTHEAAALDSPGSVLKFVLVAFIASTCAAAFAACGGQLSGQFGYAGFFLEVCMQYFDLTVVVGLPLYQWITFSIGMEPKVPGKVYERRYSARSYLPDYALCALASLLAWTLLAFGRMREASAQAQINPWCVILMIAIGVMACLPLCRSKERVPKAPKVRSSQLEGQLILLFTLLFSAFMVVYACAMGLQLKDQVFVPSVLWHVILTSIGICQSVLICVLSFSLYWVHRHATRPVQMVATYVEDFVRGDSLRSDELAIRPAGNEIDVLCDSVNGMAREVRRYTREASQRAAVEERARAEMDVARQIQKSALPQEPLRVGATEICASMEAARAVGGDFFDYHDLGDGRWFFAVGDVSGKGITGALLMMRAKALMQDRLGQPLSQLMAGVNDELARNNDNMMFVTIFAGVYDASTGCLAYVNAGHNPPVFWDRHEARFLDSPPDVAAGVMEGVPYAQRTMEVPDDFALLVYSDGVTEAQDASGSFYGEAALLDAAKGALEGTAEQAVRTVRTAVDSFVNGAEQADDITILCLRHRMPASGAQDARRQSEHHGSGDARQT